MRWRVARDFSRQCIRCGELGVEVIDDWIGTHCPRCHDILFERDRERREFEHYHPPLSDDERLPVSPDKEAR